MNRRFLTCTLRNRLEKIAGLQSRLRRDQDPAERTCGTVSPRLTAPNTDETVTNRPARDKAKRAWRLRRGADRETFRPLRTIVDRRNLNSYTVA